MGLTFRAPTLRSERRGLGNWLLLLSVHKGVSGVKSTEGELEVCGFCGSCAVPSFSPGCLESVSGT